MWVWAYTMFQWRCYILAQATWAWGWNRQSLLSAGALQPRPESPRPSCWQSDHRSPCSRSAALSRSTTRSRHNPRQPSGPWCRDGAARRKRHQVYPELQHAARCRLTVVGLETGGRWLHPPPGRRASKRGSAPSSPCSGHGLFTQMGRHCRHSLPEGIGEQFAGTARGKKRNPYTWVLRRWVVPTLNYVATRKTSRYCSLPKFA